MITCALLPSDKIKNLIEVAAKCAKKNKYGDLISISSVKTKCRTVLADQLIAMIAV